MRCRIAPPLGHPMEHLWERVCRIHCKKHRCCNTRFVFIIKIMKLDSWTCLPKDVKMMQNVFRNPHVVNCSHIKIHERTSSVVTENNLLLKATNQRALKLAIRSVLHKSLRIGTYFSDHSRKAIAAAFSFKFPRFYRLLSYLKLSNIRIS